MNSDDYEGQQRCMIFRHTFPSEPSQTDAEDVDTASCTATVAST